MGIDVHSLSFDGQVKALADRSLTRIKKNRSVILSYF